MTVNNTASPKATYSTISKEGCISTFTVKGRDRWALEQLIKTGSKGCTPIDNPAPRWSAYIFSLRALGLPINTHTEAHKGPFAGNHARYELVAPVALVDYEVFA